VRLHFLGLRPKSGLDPRLPYSHAFSVREAELKRDTETYGQQGRSRFTASGVWAPESLDNVIKHEECRTVDELFWVVLAEAFRRAKESGKLVSVITQPGWNYDTKIGSLPSWGKEEITKGR